MSGVKHTRGPWRYEDNAPHSVGSAWVSSDEVREIAMCNGTRKGSHGFCYVMNDGENEANARLIAAAPDLLTVAIKSHEPYVGLSEEDIRSVYGLEEAKLAIALRDAITRATGDRPEKGGAL